MPGVVTKRIVRLAAPSARLPDSLHPVLRRVYAARGVREAGELDYSLRALPDWRALSGIETAAARLAEAIERGERIVVVGDYDADGATSSALAVRGLRMLGARDVDFQVPNRFLDGYGLTPRLAASVAGRAPRLLVTVDNGIASVEGVAEAIRLGMEVIVTDHHLPGPTLPAALAIVNPNLPGETFPSRHLAGVGVMFYVLVATRALMRERGRFADGREPNLAALLDLVALGTVADVVKLDHLNRLLVWNGLARLRGGQGSVGVQALAEVAGRELPRLAASDLGFALGPRLNAAGRLEDMALGIRTLLAETREEALGHARELDALNRQRRDIELDMREQALASLERLQRETPEDLPPGLCLFDADWHQGVVGLLAGRVKDRWHRPVVAFAEGEAGELRGSARSIPGLHIRDVLAAVDAGRPGLIRRFGGHAMAAGLSLGRGDYEAFKAAFEREVAARLEPAQLQGTLESDGPLGEEDLGLELAERIERGGPWGQGFAEPLFDDEFEVLECRPVGERHRRLRLRRPGGARSLRGIAFEPDERTAALLGGAGRVRLAYRLTVDRYWNEPEPQLRVEQAEPA